MVGLLLALLSVSAFAQPQPGQMVGAPFRDFSGGLNDNADPSAIAQNESPDLLNVVIDDPIGALTPRTGFIQCGTIPSGNTPTGLFQYSRSNGTKRLIVTDNENYYQTADCISYTTIRTGLEDTAYPSFSIVRDKLWVATRSTHVFTWDGTTATILDGTANTPNPPPPNCSYLDFWKERVWCARTSGEASSISFSALTDSSGDDVDPSTGSVSWPAVNVIYVNQDDGCPIYGIRSFRDNLYAFKGECGIYKILFRNEFDIEIIKTLATVGTRFNESIAELDNFLYFVGPDGIYAFDGDNSQRISDKIVNKFQSLKQPITNDQLKAWTLGTDFDDGTFNAAGVGDDLATVTLSSAVFQDDFSDGNITASPAWTNTSGNWSVSSGEAVNSAGSGNIYTTQTISTGAFQFDARAYPSSGNKILVKFFSNGTDYENSEGYALQIEHGAGDTVNLSVQKIPGFTNITNGTASGVVPDNGADNLNTYKVVRTTAGVFKVYENGELQINGTDTSYNTATNVFVNCANGNCGVDDIFFWSYDSSGTWISDVHNAVEVSSWSVYEANSENNSGSVAYAIHVSSDNTTLPDESYDSITPGSLITGATYQIYAQTRVTLTRNDGDYSLSPSLEDVTINWSQGEISSSKIYSFPWDNRLWVSATSGTATSNNIVLNKARAPLNSWVPYNFQIGPMTRFNDRFYAAASTHSAIYRMDFGSTDNGDSFDWYWTSRDESWGDFTRYKRLLELQIDYRKDNAANTKLGYSSDYGSTWTERTINMSGTGRGSSRQFVNAGRNIDFRFRIRNNTAGEKATILGITGWAIPEFRRQ